MKQSYHVQVVDYAVTNKIDDELTFASWVPHTSSKCDCILYKIESKYWKDTDKFGIKIPKTVSQQAQAAIDNKKCDTL
jgi:hypothetical protein